MYDTRAHSAHAWTQGHMQYLTAWSVHSMVNELLDEKQFEQCDCGKGLPEFSVSLIWFHPALCLMGWFNLWGAVAVIPVPDCRGTVWLLYGHCLSAAITGPHCRYTRQGKHKCDFWVDLSSLCWHQSKTTARVLHIVLCKQFCIYKPDFLVRFLSGVKQ